MCMKGEKRHKMKIATLNVFVFLRKINENSYYHFSKVSPPSYYSFSFSARTDSKTIDYVKYVNLWENFINTHYKGKYNIVPSASSQLKLHRDVKQIDKFFFDDDFWLQKGNGDFLLIRINREANTDEEKDRILNYMGKTEFHVGETTVVPINEYFNPFLRKRINELYISAYKIVNQITEK